MSSEAGVSNKIAELQQRYIGNLAGRLSSVESAWSSLADQASKAALDELHTHYHKLAGSAGMYGFAELSAVASVAEQAIDQYLQDGVHFSVESLSAHQDEFDKVCEEIKKILEAAKL